MSWGVDIQIEHPDGYTTVVEVVEGHTYNLTPMWQKAGIVGESTSELQGLNVGRLAPVLSAGLLDAVRHSGDYKALNPENGWGDYDGFLKILTRFAILAWDHPTGTLRWNG